MKKILLVLTMLFVVGNVYAADRTVLIDGLTTNEITNTVAGTKRALDVVVIDSTGAQVSSFGGGAGGGANALLVGVDKGAYAFDASAQTVTLTGLRTLAIEEVLQIVNITDGITIYNSNSAATIGTISGNVITLTYDTTSMADADSLQVYVYNEAAVDQDLDVIKTIVQNPIELLQQRVVNAANQASDIVLTAFDVSNYKAHSLSFIHSGGVTNYVWATLDPDETNADTTGWFDISGDLTGQNYLNFSLSASDVIATMSNPDSRKYAKLMIQSKYEDATNSNVVRYNGGN